MKYIRFTILFFALSCWGSNAQPDMTTVFTAMPDALLPQLESAWRKDLVDLYCAGKEARLQNMMNGVSVLEKLTADYLLLQITTYSTLELKLLPLVNHTYILCAVTTVNIPVPDSRVDFYSLSWEPLPADDIFTPLSTRSFIREGADDPLLDRLDMDLVHYQLHPDTTTLTATFTTPLYLTEEEQERLAPFLKTTIVYIWKKSHYLSYTHAVRGRNFHA